MANAQPQTPDGIRACDESNASAISHIGHGPTKLCPSLFSHEEEDAFFFEVFAEEKGIVVPSRSPGVEEEKTRIGLQGVHTHVVRNGAAMNRGLGPSAVDYNQKSLLASEEDDALFLDVFSGELGSLRPRLRTGANPDARFSASDDRGSMEELDWEASERPLEALTESRPLPASLTQEEDNSLFLDAFAQEMGIYSPLRKRAAAQVGSCALSLTGILNDALSHSPPNGPLAVTPPEFRRHRLKEKHWTELMVTKGMR